MKIASLVFAFIFTCPLFAVPKSLKDAVSKRGGNWVGNGGIVVACNEKAGQTRSLQLLDFYELELRGKSYKIPEGDLTTKVERLIDRLEGHDPKRRLLYQSKAQSFFERSRFVDSLPETDDIYFLLDLPSHCKYRQALVQNPGADPDQALYSINAGVWQDLDLDNQAGLILHEIIYSEALTRGHHNSDEVRKFVGMLVIDGLKGMDALSYRAYTTTRVLATQDWVDPQTSKSWTFLQGANLGQESAERACKSLAAGRLPTSAEFQDFFEDRSSVDRQFLQAALGDVFWLWLTQEESQSVQLIRIVTRPVVGAPEFTPHVAPDGVFCVS